MLAFTADRLFASAATIEHPVMIVEDGKIIEIGPRSSTNIPQQISTLDLLQGTIVPGFIDLHIHGGNGYDFMDRQLPSGLSAIEDLLARHGVTGYCPTTVTAPLDVTLRALERLANAIDSPGGAKRKSPRPCPLGIHLEGPFLSHARRGVHPADNLLPPTLALFERFWQAARGHIRMMTIAPELEGAPEVIAEARRRDICVSLGHSDADFAAAERGVAAGARHATHTFNAMRPLGHRDPGIVGVVLTDSRVSADIIADGIHVAPSIVKLFANAKGADNTVLITDATAATGMQNGSYRLGSMEIQVKDGLCTADGKLAGSVLSMDQAVRNLARFADWRLDQAVVAATRNPARIAGLANKGVLVPGSDADFVVLSPDGHVQRTFVGGIAC